VKRVLITGIGGFLGGYCARELDSLGWSVFGVDSIAPENVCLPPGAIYRNIQLPNSEFPALLNEWKPDACIHCAGRASVPESFKSPSADFEASVALTAWLVSCLRERSPACKLILLSSAAVYGNPDRLPISENALCQPISPYGYHKRMAEMLLEQAARVFKQPCCSVRIFSAYGAGLQRQIIWEICQQATRTGTISLQGTGEETRDFIHANDVASAVALLLDNAEFVGENYNLATGCEVKVSTIANLVAGMLPEKICPQWQSRPRIGDPQRWVADISKISALGFKPKYDLNKGLASVLRWAQAL